VKFIAIPLLVTALAMSVPTPAASPEEWQQDIRELVGLVEKNHPDPYTKTTGEEFNRRANELIANVASMADHQAAVEMMALLASIRDGHSTLHPVDPAGFNRWLPLSFYWFEDGVFVVSAHRDYADLVGARLLAIGDSEIGAVLPRVTALMGSDNASGNRGNIFYLSSLDALAALGLIRKSDAVSLRIVDRDGKERNADVRAVHSAFVLNESRFWGEMYAPVQDDILADFVLPFESMSLTQYRQSTPGQKAGLPLHVRHRRAYWFTWLPEERTLYLQLNHMTSAGRDEYASFEDFYDQAFAFVEANPVDRFILDIRYNSGGDGSVVIPFVHKFIRSDKANRAGRLFTLIGRKTYSAATMLLDQMLKHTNTLVVGEPAGSALNSYGDPRTYRLTNSGLELDLSSEYWKLVHTSLSSELTPVDIPAVFSSRDYFSGRDPALERILAIDGPWRTLDTVLAEDGAAAASRRYRQEKELHGKYEWWRPFDETNFRKAARTIGEQGDPAAGQSAFEILVDAYPESWRAWRDYGKLNLAQERLDDAVHCLQRAAAINPGDPEVNDLIEQLQPSQ
jgi:Tetratricopeptide repeat